MRRAFCRTRTLAFPQLAQEVEDATRALLERAAQQTTTAAQLHEVAVSDGTSGTIEEIPPDYSAARILALWRDVERTLAQEEPGSAAAADLERRASAYRVAYQRACDAARATRP